MRGSNACKQASSKGKGYTSKGKGSSQGYSNGNSKGSNKGSSRKGCSWCSLKLLPASGSYVIQLSGQVALGASAWAPSNSKHCSILSSPIFLNVNTSWHQAGLIRYGFVPG